MGHIRVGQSARFNDLEEAIRRAQPHDDIYVLQDVEIDRPIVVDRPLNFVGVGAMRAISCRGPLKNGRGMFLTRADASFYNLSFTDALATLGNGSGIWQEEGDVVVDSCHFRANQNGLMLAGTPEDSVRIVDCCFLGNGGGCGHTHGIYATGSLASLEVSRSVFGDTAVGHHLKTKALRTTVENCSFFNKPSGTTSCDIDVPHGGVLTVSHSMFVKGANSMSRNFIALGAEGRLYPDQDWRISSNIFINHRRGITIGVMNYSTQVKAMVQKNAFEGVALKLLGRGSSSETRPSQIAIAQGP